MAVSPAAVANGFVRKVQQVPADKLIAVYKHSTCMSVTCNIPYEQTY
jgi:hypothetical protein